MHEYVQSESLRRHMLAVEAAMRAYADYLPDTPRILPLDRALYACDELCGFLVACALVRPERLKGLEPRSVRKKLKNINFAAAVNRSDISRGAEDFGVDLDAHIEFCIAALNGISHHLFD